MDVKTRVIHTKRAEPPAHARRGLDASGREARPAAWLVGASVPLDRGYSCHSVGHFEMRNLGRTCVAVRRRVEGLYGHYVLAAAAVTFKVFRPRLRGYSLP